MSPSTVVISHGCFCKKSSLWHYLTQEVCLVFTESHQVISFRPSFIQVSQQHLSAHNLHNLSHCRKQWLSYHRPRRYLLLHRMFNCFSKYSECGTWSVTAWISVAVLSQRVQLQYYSTPGLHTVQFHLHTGCSRHKFIVVPEYKKE